LWLDPTLKYAPRQIVAESHSSEVVEGSAIDRCEYSADSFKAFNGYFFPTQFTLTTRRPRGSSRSRLAALRSAGTPASNAPLPRRIAVWNFHLDAMDCNPRLSADDFELTTKILDGTPVTMEDALHLRYVWEKGSIVPTVADRVLSRQVPFSAAASRTESRLRLILLLLVNLSLLTAFL
jgi:hypothetical protein